MLLFIGRVAIGAVTLIVVITLAIFGKKEL